MNILQEIRDLKNYAADVQCNPLNSEMPVKDGQRLVRATDSRYLQAAKLVIPASRRQEYLDAIRIGSCSDPRFEDSFLGFIIDWNEKATEMSLVLIDDTVVTPRPVEEKAQVEEGRRR